MNMAILPIVLSKHLAYEKIMLLLFDEFHWRILVYHQVAPANQAMPVKHLLKWLYVYACVDVEIACSQTTITLSSVAVD